MGTDREGRLGRRQADDRQRSIDLVQSGERPEFDDGLRGAGRGVDDEAFRGAADDWRNVVHHRHGEGIGDRLPERIERRDLDFGAADERAWRVDDEQAVERIDRHWCLH